MSVPGERTPIRALLGFLIDQRPVSFRTDLAPPAALAQLAQAASTRPLTVWGQPGLMGHVSEQYVYLTRQSALTSGGFKTLFFGRLEPAAPGSSGRSELSGHFALPWSAATLFTIGFLICALWTLHTLAGVAAIGTEPRNLLYSSAALAMVAGLFWLTRRLGRRDERWLRSRIEAALAEPEPEP